MANNFKGINTEAIADARESIKIYVDDANKYLELIKSPRVAGAFKGHYAMAVQEFINSIVEEVRKPLTELEAFNEKIEKAKSEYEQKDDEMRASLGSQQ